MSETILIIDDDEEHDDRPEAYVENGCVVIRASAIGGCLKNLVAARMGIRAVGFDNRSQLRMNEGVIHEPHILSALTRDGWVVAEVQVPVELAIGGGKVIIRGHADARLAHATEHLGVRVAEAKALGRNTYEKWIKEGWRAFRRYEWQLSSYMHGTGLPGLFAVKNRDTGEMNVTLYDEPPISLRDLKLRALKIAAATDLPACDPVMYPCQRYFLHDSPYEIDPLTGLEKKKSRAGLPPAPHEVPAEHVAAFEELCRAYEEAKEQSKEADGKRKEVGNLLLRFLDDHGIKKGLTPNGWEAVEVESERATIDGKGLREKDPDLAEAFTIRSKSRYVKVTFKGEKDEKDEEVD